MKREQAERMMRVYTDMVVEFNSGKNSYVGMDDAIKLVRELIVDAMCDAERKPLPAHITYPKVNLPGAITNPDEFANVEPLGYCAWGTRRAK